MSNIWVDNVDINTHDGYSESYIDSLAKYLIDKGWWKK